MENYFLLKVFECMSLLEKETADLYKILAEKIDNKYKVILTYIYLDTSKHYEIFKYLISFLKKERLLQKKENIIESPLDCVSELGEIYYDIYNRHVNLKNEISSIDFIEEKQLLHFLKDFRRNEVLIEETYGSFLLRVLREGEITKLPDTIIKLLISLIEEDEDKHNRILEELEKILTRETSLLR